MTVKITRHAYKRWHERVKAKWGKRKIAGHIKGKFLPKLKVGIKPHLFSGNIYYPFFVGEINDKLVFAIITPDSKCAWSGWTVVTFLTDCEIGNIRSYYDLLYQYQEGQKDEQKSG